MESYCIMFIYRIVFFFLLILPVYVQAQSYSGKWYGRAEAKAGTTYNTYLCELIILKKGNTITGELNYFFGQDEFTAKIKGTFFPATKTIELHPFKLITFFSKDPNGPDCEMDGSITLYVDGKDSVLYGQLNPVSKHRIGCPLMEISLQKETKETEEQEALVTIEPTIPIEPDSTVVPFLKADNAPIKDSLAMELEEAFHKRNFSTGPLILVQTDSIELHLYDNGKVDNDTVSVFFNRKPVSVQRGLSTKPVVIRLVLQQGENEIAMFANNLGDIPPNTALCIIYAGSERHDINLTSTLIHNGTVRIKRKE